MFPSQFVTKLAVVLTLLAGFAPFASAQTKFTFADLKKIVEEKDLRSIDQVLPLLPTEYRESFTLMHKSRSIQHSSSWAPRAILFGNDAKLVLSFNGDPTDAGYDRLEVIEFKDETDRFEFKFIYFADTQTKAEVIENPMNCIGCHGRMPNDLHPDWDVGLVWRGAYGSQDDSFAETALDPELKPELKIEAENYVQFLEGASKHPRYQHLDFSRPLDQVSQAQRSEVENRPNLRLGFLLTRLQVKRIARQIEEAPGFKALQHQIVSQLVGCESVAVEAPFRADIEAKMRSFLKPIYGDQQTEEFLRDQAPGSLEAFTIGKSLGLDLTEWPITAEKRTYAVFDGSFTFKELLASELFFRLQKRDPKYSEFYEVLGLAHSPLKLASTAGALAVDTLGGKLSTKALSACSILRGDVQASTQTF